MQLVTTQKLSHRIGELVDSIEFANSGLDWSVSQKYIYTDMDSAPIKSHKAIVRNDNGQILNIAKKSYEIIQNERIWECVNNAFAGLDYQVISCLTYSGSRKFAIIVKLRDSENYLINKDQFKNYITFVSSHDGSLSLEAYDTSLRMVCMNAIKLSKLYKGALEFRVKHTKNSELKILGMEEQIENLLQKREEFYTSLKYLMEKPVSLERAEAIISGYLGNDRLSTRAENQTSEIIDLFTSGKGNNGETLYDLFNGFTEYYTHHHSEDETKQFLSSEMGLASNKKVEFTEILFSDEKLNEIARKGESLLKERVEIMAC